MLTSLDEEFSFDFGEKSYILLKSNVNYNPQDEISIITSEEKVDFSDQILPFQSIIDFVMNCEYGVPFNPNQEDIEHEGDYYKYLTPNQFEKYKMGVCWDFVTYLTWKFNRDFPSLKVYPVFMHNPDYVRQKEGYKTHTIFLVEYRGKYYWIEASWDKYKGVHEYNSLDSSLKDISKKWFKDMKLNYEGVDYYVYNPLSKDLFGKDADTSVKLMFNQGLNKPDFSVSQTTVKKLESGKVKAKRLTTIGKSTDYDKLNSISIDNYYDLSPKDQSLITSYTGNNQMFKYLNLTHKKSLLGDRKKFEKEVEEYNKDPVFDKMTYDEWKKNRSFIKDVDRALSGFFKITKPLDKSIIVNRAVTFNDPILRDLAIKGTTSVFKGYVSCTCKKKPSWTDNMLKERKIISIIIPKGFTGLVSLGNEISMFPDECEVLLNRGTYYKVIDDKTLIVSDKELK